MADTQTSHPLATPLMILTFAAGIVDAVGYVALGRVFTSLMTGNIAFLGLALAGYEEVSVVRSLAALGSFFAGAAIGGRIAHGMKASTHRVWLWTVTGFEVGFMAIAVGCSLAYDPVAHTPAWSLYGIIVGTALAMGVRSATVLRLSVPDLKTTVLTLTIANLGADSPMAGGSSPRLGRRLGTLVTLSAGAGVGYLLLSTFNTTVPLLLATGLVPVATALYAFDPASQTVGWGKK